MLKTPTGKATVAVVLSTAAGCVSAERAPKVHKSPEVLQAEQGLQNMIDAFPGSLAEHFPTRTIHGPGDRQSEVPVISKRAIAEACAHFMPQHRVDFERVLAGFKGDLDSHIPSEAVLNKVVLQMFRNVFPEVGRAVIATNQWESKHSGGDDWYSAVQRVLEESHESALGAVGIGDLVAILEKIQRLFGSGHLSEGMEQYLGIPSVSAAVRPGVKGVLLHSENAAFASNRRSSRSLGEPHQQLQLQPVGHRPAPHRRKGRRSVHFVNSRGGGHKSRAGHRSRGAQRA